MNKYFISFNKSCLQEQISCDFLLTDAGCHVNFEKVLGTMYDNSKSYFSNFFRLCNIFSWREECINCEESRCHNWSIVFESTWWFSITRVLRSRWKNLQTYFYLNKLAIILLLTFLVVILLVYWLSNCCNHIRKCSFQEAISDRIKLPVSQFVMTDDFM